MNLICPAGSIKSVNKAKYRGVYLHCKLNFVDQLNWSKLKLHAQMEIYINFNIFYQKMP